MNQNHDNKRQSAWLDQQARRAEREAARRLRKTLADRPGRPATIVNGKSLPQN